MAILATDPNKQDDNSQPGQPAQTQGPDTSQQSGIQTSSGPSSSISEKSPSGANQNGAPAPKSGPNPAGTSSGRFQNLQGYIKANQSFNQGRGLAGKIGDTFGEKSQQQQQQQGTESGRVQQEAAKEGEVFRPEAAQSFVSQSLADPTQIAGDASKMAQWQKVYSGQVAAPQAFDAQGSLAQQKANFEQQAGLTGSEGGRATLLKDFYGRPSYNMGQQNLDQLLLQGQPNQLGTLQASAKSTANQLGQAYQQQQGLAQQALTNLSNDASAASQLAHDQFGQTVASSQADLQNKAAAVQAQRQAQVDEARSRLSSGALTQDLVNQFGLQTGQQIYDLDLNKYFTGGAGQVGVGNVATDADNAKFQALSKLSGGTDQQLANFATPRGPLGSALSFDTGALQRDVAQKASEVAAAQARSKALSDDIAKQEDILRGQYGDKWNDIGQQNIREWGGSQDSVNQKILQMEAAKNQGPLTGNVEVNPNFQTFGMPVVTKEAARQAAMAGIAGGGSAWDSTINQWVANPWQRAINAQRAEQASIASLLSKLNVGRRI